MSLCVLFFVGFLQLLFLVTRDLKHFHVDLSGEDCLFSNYGVLFTDVWHFKQSVVLHVSNTSKNKQANEQKKITHMIHIT